MTQQVTPKEYRVDINAAWLCGHPDCKPLPDYLMDLQEIIAEEVNGLVDDIHIKTDLLKDVRILEIQGDIYLLWWKTIFIGVLNKHYYCQEGDLLEFVCREFWKDLITWESNDGTKIDIVERLDFEREGDMKIRVPTEYRDWLVEKGYDKETITDFYNNNIYPQPMDE